MFFLAILLEAFLHEESRHYAVHEHDHYYLFFHKEIEIRLSGVQLNQHYDEVHKQEESEEGSQSIEKEDGHILHAFFSQLLEEQLKREFSFGGLQVG